MDSRWFRFPMGRKLIHPFWFPGILLIASLSYAGEARQGQSDDWEKILARARQDGRVTLGTNLGTPEFRQGVTTAFAKRYGIPL